MNQPVTTAHQPRQIVTPVVMGEFPTTKPADASWVCPTMKGASTSSSRKRKTVTFSCNVKVRNYAASSFKEDNEQEVDSPSSSHLWYSREELKDIRKEVNLTLEMFSAMSQEGISSSIHGDDSTVEEQYCRRGIEYRHPEQSRRRNQRKKIVRDAVLHEQAYQMETTGVVDAYRLAMIYRDYTYGYQIAAEKRGELDEQEVRRTTASIGGVARMTQSSRWAEPVVGALPQPIRYPFRRRTVGKYKLSC